MRKPVYAICGLSLTRSENPKTGFLVTWLNLSVFSGSRSASFSFAFLKFRTRGMSAYSEHLSTNFNISEQERGSVLYFVHKNKK